VPQIAAVVLAAGASTRYGQCKQLLDWQGKPLLAHAADVALEAGLDPVVVVLGCQAEETYSALGDRPVQKLLNYRWEEGMSTSVRTGLSGIPPDAAGAIFLQCDQPRVTPALLRDLVDRFEQTDGSIVHPVHDGRRGTPVLFPRRFFPELSSITGDEGGRSLVEKHPEQVATVPVENPDMFTDVDTPEDYAELRESKARPEPESAGSILSPIRHVIIDMDGVLWRGDEPLPGLREFFAFMDRQGIAYTLATNNASQRPDQFAERLASFGVDVSLESILTSALVVAAYLDDVAPAGSPVYVIGEDGLDHALRDRGFTITDEEAEYVVVGWDRTLSWEKLCTATYFIHRGAKFVGTNPDVTFPTEWGPAPGNGATLAALEAATGISPVVTGKPASQMYEEGLRRMDATPETTAMIGDRVDTDIAGAADVGLMTVLTLSGISKEEDVRTSSVRPDLVCDDLEELLERWREAVETS
jgi:4-nitrophenyl phosphatase